MTEKEKKKKVPENVLRARRFLAEVSSGNRKIRPSDEAKIAESKLILAVYGCQQEEVPVTIANLIIVLGPDAAETLKYLTPDLYQHYGIVSAEI